MYPSKVLVTGGLGYLGSVLCRALAARGTQVVVVDDESVTSDRQPLTGVTYVNGDVRTPDDWKEALRGVDAVAHLAAIVGDPACAIAADLAWETNYLGTVRLVEACRRAGVGALVFASTCSTYGAAGDEQVDVDSPVEPRSLYAETKVFAEHFLLTRAGTWPRPCILRFATLHGMSPRMRFDLAVNTMTARAAADGRLVVHGGEQWRPFLHVRDAAAAVAAVLSRRIPPALVYNCGSSAENYRIAEVAELIRAEVPGVAVDVHRDIQDPRNYRVNFDRIATGLGFTTEFRVADTIREVAAAIRAGRFADHGGAKYNNYLLMVERAPQPRSEAYAGRAAR